jgi:hypothetical protein
MEEFERSASFEHRFWLRVLGDHARFLRDSLAVGETVETERAEQFADGYDALLERAAAPMTRADIVEVTEYAGRFAWRLREFKLHLLRRHLAADLRINLTPSFLNHMVNENDEYLRILACLREEKAPPVAHALHHHLIWLQDAAGHAETIGGTVDFAESDIVGRSRRFADQFKAFYWKAAELAQYLRAQEADFPALRRFDRQVDLEFAVFRDFLLELKEMRLTGRALGALLPLMADHMAREECYFLHKLAQSSADVAPPACDPCQSDIAPG